MGTRRIFLHPAARIPTFPKVWMTDDSASPVEPDDPPEDGGFGAWRPELIEAIYTLLYRDDLDLESLISELEELERQEGSAVYGELLHLLAHLRFPDDEAKEHWEAVLAHRSAMEESLGSSVDVSVALVSYFVHVNRQLHQPKVIELKIFEETRASAYKDELTGLHNFRFFQEYLGWEVKRCERHGGSFAIAMGDLDNFKEFNDRFGHEAGNEALREVGRVLAECGRAEDVAIRYGGEEFVLLMPATTKEDARKVVERVRQAVNDLEFSEADLSQVLTISLGIADYPADAVSVEDLIRCADRAMYIAKARGKNQVQLYGANRRAHPRLYIDVEGELRLFKEESLSFSTVDVSERGLRFVVSQPVPLDAVLEFSLSLPEHDGPISAYGRVIRVDEISDALYEIAVTILKIDPRDFERLTRYLRAQTTDSPNEFEPF